MKNKTSNLCALLLVVGISACGGAAKNDPRTGDETASEASETAAPDSGVAAPAVDPELRAKCCDQCAAASNRDPAGFDISVRDCRDYAGEWNGGPGVDEACVAHFGASPATVGDCRDTGAKAP